MFSLVDCNNFYVSCERVFRPDLNQKPVVVLSNNDGCVIARSNEAKAIGIPMGAPAFKFKKLFKENQVKVFSSNFALYGDMSRRVMHILTEMSPEIEIYSIDEAFLKFENCAFLDLHEHGLDIQKKITRSTGIPISISFAPTKALAKVANHIVKKFRQRTNGIYLIDTEVKREKALKWLKVEDVWGIGHQHAKRLQKYGVNTAFEFTQLPDAWVRKQMSVVGLRLKLDLQGENTLDLDPPAKAKKNIATTRTFESNYTELDQVAERISTFAVSCAGKLRKQQTNCNALQVFVRSNAHRHDLKQYNRSIVVKLPYPSNSNMELVKFALYGLNCLFKTGYHYKQAGVVVMDITPENETQLSLFENSDPRHKDLMKVVDDLNQRYGQEKIKLACQDIQRTWKMRQESLSPHYTTNLNDVITVL